jgi:hypothetical protein
MTLLNREMNARAFRDAAAWDRRRKRRMRYDEIRRPVPPPPKVPRLPRWAGATTFQGAAGSDRGRGGRGIIDRTEAGDA